MNISLFPAQGAILRWFGAIFNTLWKAGFMKIGVILVGIQGAENLGYAARAMANFGAGRLCLVNPVADAKSAEAISRAMHAQGILRRAEVFGSLEKALSGFDYAVATTARTGIAGKVGRTAVSAREFASRFAKSNAKVALVFGREPSGLTNEEIAQCDFIVKIPSSGRYPSLNISHAVAVLLYELFAARAGGKKFRGAKGAVRSQIVGRFRELAEECASVADKGATTAAFKRLVSRALITGKEANAVLAVLSCALKEIRGKKTKKRQND